MKKEPELMLTARVPTALVKKLDKAASKAHRSRSGELRVLLEAAFRPAKTRGARNVA